MKKYFLISVFFSLAGYNAYCQDGMAEAIQQMGETEIENIQNHWGHLENMGEIISDGIGHLNTALDIYDNVHDMYEASNALDNNECVPDFGTDATSMMPSSCADQAGCQECYQRHVGNLTVVRRSLARMSCIRMNIKKFTDAAISFGDNVSGIHAVTGLAWQAQRREIIASVDHFNQTYDRKYTELISSLQRALNGINECEAQFGMRDWYQRFGFIYFEMMKEKYKRTD
ncbi:MAG TPA: hypothetical protein PLU37_06070 [Chitinophagaceae bacterium]|nr:hypothetical protein [Chitinophagaceae bacterium]MCB9056661.1 hypothetical protein [Chitinophagales bacterium]HPG11074.1 hypothetical protein [Chitinophagaceae bacterium]